MKKIPPSEKIRKEIDELLQEGTTGNLLGRVLHEGMRLIVQELYEAEATDFLERGHYERRVDRDFRGYRNGYEQRKIKTAEGVLEVELPQVRDTAEPFVSKLRMFLRGNTRCLEKLAAEIYARGCRTRGGQLFAMFYIASFENLGISCKYPPYPKIHTLAPEYFKGTVHLND